MNEEKRILITGANGNIGGKLTKYFADFADIDVIAVGLHPDRLQDMMKREHIINKDKVLLMSSDDMFTKDLSSMKITGAVHLAFSRSIFPPEDIAASLDYSMAAFKKIVDSNIPNAVYVSSQSVYGEVSDWRTEDMTPAPHSIYAMAKYAGEKLFEACYMNSSLQHTIIRVDLVVQSQNLVKALCKSAYSDGCIKLRGGHQVYSYLDISDVPKALTALFNCHKPWKPVYNVGPDKVRYHLLEIANYVKETAASEGIEVDIDLTEDDTAFWSGMDCSLIAKDTGWHASVGLSEMVKDIYHTVNK